jgi:small-conductance mechanosensitive channel
MGAASAGLTTVQLITGSMLTGSHRGERVGACTDCRRYWGKFRAEEIDQAEIHQVNTQLVASVGTCSVMGTASTMACIAEALGMTVPGGASPPAVTADRIRVAEESGRVAVEMARKGLTIDKVLTEKAFENAMRVLLLVIGTLFALSSLGFDLTTLSVVGGALGVGIGFGLQKLAANYVSGFVILLERSLRIGDFVRVDGFEGRVTDIKTRYTLVRASNGSESVVPNELLLTQRVENLSLESRHLLQTCTYWVSLDSYVSQVQALMLQAALSAERVLSDPAPQPLLAEVAPQGLRFTMNFWMDDPVNGQSLTRSGVNIAVLNALREGGVLLVKSPQEVVLHSLP